MKFHSNRTVKLKCIIIPFRNGTLKATVSSSVHMSEVNYPLINVEGRCVSP